MDLRATGVPHDENIELGAMIEVPALVPILDQILPHVDFISVGTNDLVQYLLAVDRDNPRVAGMYDPYHPSVARVLRTITKFAEGTGKTVSVCGEIAGDHYFTPLLLGLGVRELSMAPVFLPRVKLMVRSFAMEECERIAEEALIMDSAKSIRELVRDHSRRRWSRFLSRAVKGEGE